MPQIIIHFGPETLSDGSEAFNVKLPAATLHAKSERDATALALAIARAINQRTTDNADTHLLCA